MDNPYVSFTTGILKNNLHTFSELENICKFHSEELKLIEGDHKLSVLMAIAKVETDLGKNNVPRWELGYSRSSLAFKKSKLLQEGYNRYGDLCAMSFGAHQILWIVAVEMGYPMSSHPLDLWSSVISCPYVVEKINENISKGAKTVDEIFATYNGGPGILKNRDKWPKNYVTKAMAAYYDFRKKYETAT